MRGRLAVGAFVAGSTWLHQFARLPDHSTLMQVAVAAALAFALAALLAALHASAPATATATALVFGACARRALHRPDPMASHAERHDPRSHWTLVLLVMAAGATGFVQAGWRAQARLDDGLACLHRDHVMRVTVQVIGLAAGTEQARRFDVQVLGHEDYCRRAGVGGCAAGAKTDLQGGAATASRGHAATASRGRAASRVAGVLPDGVPGKIRVSWRAPFGSNAALPEVVPGQVWRMALRLRPPRATRNPYGPDIEGRLFSQGVRAMGAVQGQPILRADDPWSGWTTALGRLRHVLRAAAFSALGERPYAAVLVALALGDQSAMARADWVMFGRAGISHLVAISGLHVGLVAGLGGWGAAALYRRVRVRGRQAAQVLPAQIVMAIAAWLAAALYCSLAGWGIPAQRVFVMLSAIALAIIWRVPVSASRTLMVAAAVIVVIDPWAPLAMGFWLSFAAVGALMMMVASASGAPDVRAACEPGEDEHHPAPPESIATHLRRLWTSWRTGDPDCRGDPLRRPPSAPDDLLHCEDIVPGRAELFRELRQAVALRLMQWVGSAARVQWFLTLALAPLLAVTVGQVSLVSPLVNAFAIPIIGVLVTPMALGCIALAGLGVLGIPGAGFAAQGLGAAAHALVGPTLDAARWLSTPSWAVWPVASAPWPYAFLALACVGWALLPPGAPGRRLAWMGILPLLLWRPALKPVGDWDLVALDVGQAGAAVITTRHHTLVFDAGNRYDSGDDAGSRTVVPFLQAIGRSGVDRLIVSHQHLDHVGGVRGLMGGLPIERSLAPFDLNRQLAREAATHYGGTPARGWPLNASACAAGQQWTIDGVTFSVVHPAAGSRYSQAQVNASSCVLVVRGAHHTAVLPGDIGAVQERAVAREIGAVDVVIAAHHGSSTSSCAQWVQTLKPSHVIAQSAYYSRFGHPAATIQQRWTASGAAFWRNDLDGAIWVSSRAQSLDVRAWRDHTARYWHEPLSPLGDDRCDVKF